MPIEYRDRPEGSESKLNTVKDGVGVLKTIANFFKNYKPFRFFGLLALLFAILGTAFFIPVLIDYTETGLVPKMPTLLVSIFFYICMLQSFFSGLILQNTVEKAKQQFEIQLNIFEQKFQELKKKK